MFPIEFNGIQLPIPCENEKMFETDKGDEDEDSKLYPPVDMK
jgi:hypothetical protein